LPSSLTSRQILKHFANTMIESTKINRWLVALAIVLFAIAVSQAYLLSQKNDENLASSQLNLFDENHNFSTPPTLKNLDPLAEIQKLQKNMHRNFEQGFNNQFSVFPNLDFGKISNHEINITEEGKYFLVTLEVPGLKDTDLNVTVKDQTLNISGVIEKTIENKNNESFSRQFSSQRFQQMATLPGPVKPESINISYEGDSLKIKIEKNG